MMAEFPNVIIISQEIPHSGAAGSLLLLRLFQDWPIDKLMVLGPKPPPNAQVLECQYSVFAPFAERIQRSRFASLAWAVSLFSRSSLEHFDHRSDVVVVTVMQTFIYYRAAYLFARRKKLPLVVIVYDDPEEIEPSSLLTRPLFRENCRRIYRFARFRLCISPQMCDLLGHRYGAPGTTLYPNRSKHLKPRPLEECRRLRRPDKLVIGYVGTLGYGYGETLNQLAPILSSNDGILRIYSRRRPHFANGNVAEYAGAFELPEDVWDRVKDECDVVILAYSFHPLSHQRLYLTHFPSKLPEYLALGMPVIITGPARATGVIWGLENPSAALTICELGEERWRAAVCDLIHDAELRERLAKQALAAGNKYFDPERIEKQFRHILQTSTSNACECTS